MFLSAQACHAYELYELVVHLIPSLHITQMHVAYCCHKFYFYFSDILNLVLYLKHNYLND